MASDISPEVIKLTQDSLGEFVKKPALSEKLLKKPPFRFLHDIITAVQKSTGFFDGLFTDEELVSENVKDRESKIAFLNKVIDVVNIVTDSSLSVRSSKIIAGLEPEKTNELLQQLGIALRQNAGNKIPVDNVIQTKEPKKTTKTSVSSKKDETKIKKTKSDTNKKITKDVKPVKKSTVGNNKSVVRSVSKDKGKVDTASDSDKASVRSNKSDLPKKPKVKEKAVINSKTNKENEIHINNNKKEKLSQMSTESVDILPADVYGKRVELTDILGDSDDLTSIEPEIISNDKIQQPPQSNNHVDDNKIERDSFGEKNVTNGDVNEERPVRSSRPQSRLSRQRKSLTETIVDTENVPSVNKKLDENVPSSAIKKPEVVANKVETSNVKNEIHNNDNQRSSTASDKESADSTKTRSVRTASSKKSLKANPEPMRAIHSLSVDNKNDNEVVERRPPPPEVENKPPPRMASANLRPPSVRPSSARPGAPRLKEKNVDVIVTPSEPVVVGKVHVIVENYENQNEDDEGGVEVLQIASDDNIISGEVNDTKGDSIPKGHGLLVQQILETQKELSQDETSKVEIEWEYGSRREREVSYKEIEGIRNGLQLLSRASNPLGKLMDYIQEDVEVMRQELLQWREARAIATTELKQQQSLTAEQIQPLHAKLKQIENSISEQVELIYTVKSNIHRNTQKIGKLIDGDE